MDEASARLSGPGASLNLLGFGLVAVRVWQCTSSLFAYTSLALLYHHSKASHLSQNDNLRIVQLLSLVALIYATLVICGVHISKTLRLQRVWRVCAILSVPGDLAMMGICLANITLLAYTGLPADCHGFTPANNEANDLLHQPATGFETSRIGWAWPAALTAELDRVCAFPRTVYGLSVFAIFSYTFSILLSVLYLQQQQQHHLTTEAGGDHGSEDVEKASQSRRNCSPIKLISFRWRCHAATFTQHVPPANLDEGPRLDTAGQVRPPFFSPSPFHQQQQQQQQQEPSIRSFRSRNSHVPTTSSRTLSVASNDSSTSWGALTTTTTLVASESDSIFLPGPSTIPPPPAFWPGTIAAGAGAAEVSHSPPPPPSTPPPQRRWSTSTSSSYNANAFIVTDGFRPEDAVYTHTPPAYSSPPGSLYHETMKYDGALGVPGLPQQ